MSTPKLTTVSPFNPLEKKVLGSAIAEVLVRTSIYPLSQEFPLRGPGIYALYYTGNFSAYSKLAAHNRKNMIWPIYVGQALPGGGRRGIEVIVDDLRIRKRIQDHRKSIAAARKDLHVGDFQYRALVMDDSFIRLGETSLIAIFQPVWNRFLDGFGNHVPGANRVRSTRSVWDTLHGGRAHAEEHQGRNEPREDIIAKIKNSLENYAFDSSVFSVSALGQTPPGAADQVNIERVVDNDEPS